MCAATSRSSGTTIWRTTTSAQQVWFVTRWRCPAGLVDRTRRRATACSYSHVIDARSGNVLYRSDLVDHERGDALVVDYYPGARGAARPES